MKEITKDHTIFEKYKKQKQYSSNEYIILESEKVINFAVSLGHKLIEIVSHHDFYQRNPTIDAVYKYQINKKELSEIIGYKSHSGVFALIKKPIQQNSYHNNILILNGLTSPENVGSICRSAAAFNFKSVIYDKNTCSPFVKRAIRVSTGHVLALDIHHEQDILKRLTLLRQNGYDIIAAINSDNSISLEQFKYNNNSKKCLIIGSEGHGIDSEVLNESNIQLKIETNAIVSHLNAAIAASIIMNHLKN